MVGQISVTEGGDELGSRLPPLCDVPPFLWPGDLTAESATWVLIYIGKRVGDVSFFKWILLVQWPPYVL